jgi:hypothetical protein
MAAAKSLTGAELDQVLSYIAQHSNAARNRMMTMMTLKFDTSEHFSCNWRSSAQ